MSWESSDEAETTDDTMGGQRGAITSHAAFGRVVAVVKGTIGTRGRAETRESGRRSQKHPRLMGVEFVG